MRATQGNSALYMIGAGESAKKEIILSKETLKDERQKILMKFTIYQKQIVLAFFFGIPLNNSEE